MFNKKRLFFTLVLLNVFSNVTSSLATDAGGVAVVNSDSLPINVAESKATHDNAASAPATGLVSPSQAQQVVPTPTSADNVAKADSSAKASVAPVSADTASSQSNSDFNFDLKMKSISASANNQNTPETTNVKTEGSDTPDSTTSDEADADIPSDIQYKVNPADNLGNSILSQMDGDLFTQMSEIEKSMTLLTLELRREKIRNEIEAQKAIRRKSADDLERQRSAEKLRLEEQKRKMEAQVIKEKQLLVDKERVVEVLRQRKLLNAYMNQMLVNQQEWLKEKEALYNRLAIAEQEKQDLIELFKSKIGTVLEASAKNIQTAEAAKANFQRIVKGLKARNEQLRKRIEADAQIIKNAKSNLYLKSQSIEELKDKSAALAAASSKIDSEDSKSADGELDDTALEEDNTASSQQKLSAEYAILGITGRAGVMTVELIDSDGQPLTLKIGSPLPTGHVVSEIGSDYAKFSRDGHDDYLYVGRSIDGIVPTLGLVKTKN